MRILLLCSAFNGLSQRVWAELRADHDVTVRVTHAQDALADEVVALDPDLILCPFLKDRVPERVWRSYRTVIVHPGPVGDRGPSSLDWAVMEDHRRWGVTALQAIDEMDAGPIWGTRRFPMPTEPPRKSTLYNGAVADAALSLVHEVVAKAADPAFRPEPLDYDRPDVEGRLRQSVRQSDRAFSWAESTEHVLRRIRAADGSPGVRAELAGVRVSVFDAHRGSAPRGKPGTVALRRHGAVLVRTGDGAVWVGHARRIAPDGAGASVKLPATLALGRAVAGVPEALEPLESDEQDGYREISYRRSGDVGMLGFDFYNGAMSTGQCHRLAAAVRYAAAQDTKVLVVEGGEVFSNGIHLGVIEAHANPMTEAWRNINAINDVCREILTCTGQIVVSAVGGGAGAGGVALALGADRVVVREGVLLNPHYRTMGLYGSEYWTYVLPRRVGRRHTERLTTDCEPVNALEAARLGLADAVLPGDRASFTAGVVEYASTLAADPASAGLLRDKQAARAADELRRPLDTYRVRELAQMSRDIFDDRHGFAAARHAFLTKAKPAETGQPHLPAPRRAPDAERPTASPSRWSTFRSRIIAAGRR